MASATRMSLMDEAKHDFDQNRYSDAANKFVLLTSTQPDYKKNPLVQLNLGRCFFELKQYAKAVENLEIASTLFAAGSAEHAELTQQAYFLLGRSQFELRKYEAAKNSLQEANNYDQPKTNITAMITECEEKINQDAAESDTTASTIAAASPSEADRQEADAQQDPQSARSTNGTLSLQQITEAYPDVVTSQERLTEGYQISAMLREMPTRIEVDSEWYFLPKKWFDKWETYCYVDIINATPGDEPNSELSNVDRSEKPGKIKFSELFLPQGDNQITDIAIKFIWQNHQVKKGLREGVDFIFVTKDIMAKFSEKYSSRDVNALANYKRIGVEQDDGEVVLEMQMRKINFFPMPNKTTYRMKEPWFCYVPKSDNVLALERKVLRCLNNYMNSVRHDRSSLTMKCRLWVTNDSKMEDLGKIDQKYMNYTHATLDAIPVSATDEQKKLKVDDLNFVDEDIFLVETPKNGKFVFTQKDGDDEESKEAIANEIAEMAEEASGLFSMDVLLAQSFNQLVPARGTAKGLCGLQNLGNTCFMNSGLQCLSNIPELTKYFLMGYHLKEANTDNPLGMKGKLAKAFGILVKELWLGRDSRTAPYDLKRTLGNKISRFSGYGQQDSAELINYLLDLIHEDLNRVRTKPYVEVSEDMNRPEAVIAKEYWDGFQARNASIIVDLMYGQYKSTVTCLTCNRVKHGYDPYLSVCLPIVKEEKLEFNYVSEYSHTKIQENDEEEPDFDLNALTVVDVVVTKSMKIGDVKTAVLASLSPEGVTKDSLVVCNQKYGKITDIFEDKTSCDDIDQDREYTMVYHVPNQTEETQVIELNFLKLAKRGKNSYTTDFVDKSAPRLFALTNETTIMDIKRLILDKMRGIFTIAPETDEDLNSIVQVHVRENLPMIQQGKYTRTRATCEFCGSKHSYKEDYCDLKFDDEDVNETVETSTNATIGQIIEMMTYKRRLILAIVIKSQGNYVNFNELRCKYRRNQDESEMTLDARSQKTLNLSACFNGYSAEETLGGDDQWYCNICKEHRDITKKMELYSTPKILILQLKRFQQRRGASNGRSGMFGHMYAQIAGQEKNDAFVEFPMEKLDMRPYVRKLANEPEPVYYDLIGVSNHFGSLNGGHYTASCKNIQTGEWSYFNDSNVSNCSKSKIVSPAAYILFYRKREASTSSDE